MEEKDSGEEIEKAKVESCKKKREQERVEEKKKNKKRENGIKIGSWWSWCLDEAAR